MFNPILDTYTNFLPETKSKFKFELSIGSMLNKDELRKNKKIQNSIRKKTINYLNSVENSIENESISNKNNKNNNIENLNNKNMIKENIDNEFEYKNNIINNNNNVIINNLKIEKIDEQKKIEEEKKIEALKIEENNKEIKKEEIKNISYNLNEHLLLKGLLNIGNSCYMNTSIQILLHCQFFINKLTNDPEKPITNSLYNLLNLMIKDSNTKISPISFKLIFEKKHSDYEGKRQHDSIEFTRILLDDISIENNISKQNIIYEELITKNKSSHELDKEFDLLYRKRENSFIIDLFYNQILNTFKCKCNHENYSLEKIIDIPLLFSNYLMYFSLEKLLDTFFNEESLKWERECEKCHKKEKHIKTMKLTHLSKILIISFQRINQITGRKNNSYVEFPIDLNMKKYSEKGIPNLYYYDLFAIINHSGTIKSGHYTAIIKLNKEWYEFNDSKVKKIEIKNNYILSNLVYCLYYIKK